jgi:hypothetical protein
VGSSESNIRKGRRRSRVLGVAASLALHVLVLVPLALALRVTTLFPPAPTIDVQLVRMAPSRVEETPPPPKPTPKLSAKQHEAPPAPPPITIPVPPTPIAPVMDEATRQRLLAAPFGQRSASARLRAGAACVDDYVKLSEADRERCRQQVREAAANRGPDTGEMDPARRSAFDEAKRSDEQWRRYRDSANMGGYPGVRNAFGRNGGAVPPPSAYDKLQGMGPSYRREDPNNPSGGL